MDLAVIVVVRSIPLIITLLTSSEFIYFYNTVCPKVEEALVFHLGHSLLMHSKSIRKYLEFINNLYERDETQISRLITASPKHENDSETGLTNYQGLKQGRSDTATLFPH